MHYGSVPGCIFACYFHISPSPSVTWWAFSLWWSQVISWGRLLSVEASLAAGTGECSPYSTKWVREWPWLGAARLDILSCIQENGILHLIIFWELLILWIIDLKLSNLICCVANYSLNLLFPGYGSPVCTVTYTGKMAFSILSWASNSICRHFALGVCPSVFFSNMDTMSPHLIQIASGTGENQNVHELFRYLSSERHSDVSQEVSTFLFSGGFNDIHTLINATWPWE